MEANAVRGWVPPGPVSRRFMFDNSAAAAINGPIGAGKTITNFMRHLRHGFQQRRSPRDGLRYYKLCTVRDTYRQLWKTTIPSWHKRFPDTDGEWVGSKDAPARHKLRLGLPDGTVLVFEHEFVAIGDNDAETVLKGFEVTGFYLNEGDELAEEVFLYARGRAGRFPDMDMGGPTWRGVTLDFNAPALGNWCYKTFYRALPEGFAFFRQPGGREPGAENLQNLPPGYYADQVPGQPDWYVRKMIDNIPGITRAGKPIYPEFKDTLHVADHELAPVEGLPLRLGMDAGLQPGAAITQRLPNGQWLILDELCGEAGTGPNRFGKMLAQLIQERYAGWSIRRGAMRAWADPSAAYGADKVNDEMDWMQIVSAAAGIRVDAAPTNNPSARWDAVRAPLTRLIDGGKPGLLLSPRCQKLRDGFNSGYHFRRTRGLEARILDEAEKNEYSHIHDALQYVLSAEGEDLAIRERKAFGGPQPGQVAHVHDWDPFGAHA